jgi:SnoaL-like domain
MGIGEGDRMPDEVELLKRLYDRFNARDMETLLAAMHQDVIWANGMEGGHVHGREGVRSYWTRQWAMIDPHVEPLEFSKGPKGENRYRSPSGRARPQRQPPRG